MVLGALGSIVFQVSDDTVKTLNNMNWGGSARYATHQRHGYHAMTEYTGMGADTISFDMILSAYLGVNPQQVIAQLFTYERNGVALPLVLGSKGYGKFRWVITKHSMKSQYFDGNGDLTHCKVTVNLQEYIYW